MKGWRLTSTGHRPGRHLAQPSHARTLGLRKGFFMLPSGVQAQPPRQPSEAAYGSSGRPREVGAILRRTPTFVTIAAQPSPPVRRERALTSRHGTTVAAGRYTPRGPPP